MDMQELRLECLRIVSFSRTLEAVKLVEEAMVLETYIRGEDVTFDGYPAHEAPSEEAQEIVEATGSNVVPFKPEWAAPAL